LEEIISAAVTESLTAKVVSITCPIRPYALPSILSGIEAVFAHGLFYWSDFTRNNLPRVLLVGTIFSSENKRSPKYAVFTGGILIKLALYKRFMINLVS
jgi:hypothetical protein